MDYGWIKGLKIRGVVSYRFCWVGVGVWNEQRCVFICPLLLDYEWIIGLKIRDVASYGFGWVELSWSCGMGRTKVRFAFSPPSGL